MSHGWQALGGDQVEDNDWDGTIFWVIATGAGPMYGVRVVFGDRVACVTPPISTQDRYRPPFGGNPTATGS